MAVAEAKAAVRMVVPEAKEKAQKAWKVILLLAILVDSGAMVVEVALVAPQMVE
jgi:hypothetical protein